MNVHSKVYFSKEALAALVEHAERGYPHEVCGLLLGEDLPDSYSNNGGVLSRLIRAVVPVDNSFEAGERYHRFLIGPADILRAERQARQAGLDVLGVYHSHPNAPARPSEYDREHAAWTTWTYLIVPVRDGRAGQALAWHLREDRSAFDEVELRLM
jgi:proteasome lid subunit RPN8/RPN11